MTERTITLTGTQLRSAREYIMSQMVQYGDSPPDDLKNLAVLIDEVRSTKRYPGEVGRTTQGFTVFREPNEAGGVRYISDAVGGGVTIWDTTLTSKEELLIALCAEVTCTHEE